MTAPKRQNYEIPSLKKNDKRVETGPVSFNFDWAGLFVRGDDCHALLGEFCHHLRTVVEKGGPEVFATSRPLVRLVRLLAAPVGYSKSHGLYVAKFLDLLDERLADPKRLGLPLFDLAEVTPKTLADVEKAFRACPDLPKMTDGNKKVAKIREIVEGLVMAGKVPWWTVPTWRPEKVDRKKSFGLTFGIPGDAPAFVVRPFDERKEKGRR